MPHGSWRLTGETPQQGQLRQLREAHPYLFTVSQGFLYVRDQISNLLSVIFATWPSMHEPIKFLLNVSDEHEADKLTEKWTEAKLRELQYVGLSSALVTGTIASAFSWSTVPDDPWSTEALWTSALVLALTAISLATQQTIGLSRLSSCEKGWQKIRRLLGEQNPYYGTRSMRRSFGRLRRYTESRVRIKKSQLWIWQTPVMLSNFAILLFVIGLMISIFVRAVRLRGDWSQGRIQIAIFYGCATIFAGANYLFCWLALNRGSLESDSDSDFDSDPDLATQEDHHRSDKSNL